MAIGVQIMASLHMNRIFGNDDPIFMGTTSGNWLLFCNLFYICFIHFISQRNQMPINAFRVESSKWETVTSYVEDGCNSSKCFKGWAADVFHMMQRKLNFTYTIVSEDDAVGKKQRDGSYTGILG